MQIPQGYKQTEVGIIPQDWEATPLSIIGEIKMCKRVMKYQTSETGDVPFYKIGTFGKKADAYISRQLFDDFKNKYNYPKKGSILLSAAGTIGRTVKFDGNDAYFQDSNIVWIDNDESKVLNDFLFYCYKIVEWQTEDGGIVTRLYNGNLRATKFTFPKSIDEQRRIVAAITEIDELIVGLGEQIAKKRQIKEGAMRQLLTGKTRLPGFTQPWQKTKFKNICFCQRGSILTSNEYESGNIPVIAGGKLPAGFHNKANRKGISITVSGSGANAGYVAKYEVPIFASDCFTIGESDNYNINFIYYSLELAQEEIYKLQTGGAQPHVHPKDLEPFEILYTTDLEEQTAIAEVLSDMDDEIRQLEAERDKYTLVKQGMMQELLTGKTRLV